MKKNISYLLMLLCINIMTLNSFSQSKILNFKGIVTTIIDPKDLLDSTIHVDDSIRGTITYNLNIADSNELPQVGDYWYNSSPYGIWIGINNLIFQTDTNNVRFILETVNNYYDRDNILFRSYTNIYPNHLNTFSEKIISWQLDDTNQTAISGINIPEGINLGDWQQIVGLQIDCSKSVHDSSILIKAIITSIDLCSFTVTDIENFTQKNDIVIYPNPAYETIIIKSPEKLIGSGYTITDITGRKVLRGLIISNETTINITQLNSGLYSVQFDNKSDRAIKFIKKQTNQ